MKKLLLLLLTGFLGLQHHVTACDGEKVKGNGNITTTKRELAAFDKINTAGNIDLVIDQNGNESAVVETDENLQELIITKVENGALNINVKEHYNVNATKLQVRVSCKTLSKINSGGSGDIRTASILHGDELAISHGGSGDFLLTLDVKKLKISTAGSGDYVLSGTANEFTLSAAGSGDVNARDLAIENAKISTAGSGDVKLRKGTQAKISSAGSGDVYYE